MPLSQAKPDALAAIYAGALLDLAERAGGRDAAEAALGELEDILELARADQRFAEFLSSRILAARRRDPALRAIFEGRASDLMLRFLRLLNAKGRLAHLPAIAAAYDHLVQARHGRVEVDVISAVPLEPHQLDSIRDRVSAMLGGKDIIARPAVDPAILGGLRLRIGDQLIDASVSNHLRRLTAGLRERGRAAVRERMGDMLDN